MNGHVRPFMHAVSAEPEERAGGLRMVSIIRHIFQGWSEEGPARIDDYLPGRANDTT